MDEMRWARWGGGGVRYIAVGWEQGWGDWREGMGCIWRSWEQEGKGWVEGLRDGRVHLVNCNRLVLANTLPALVSISTGDEEAMGVCSPFSWRSSHSNTCK